MPRDLVLLLTPLVSLAVAGLAQIASYRLRHSMPLSYITALLGGTLCLGALSWLLPGTDIFEDLAMALVNLGTFLGLWLCFVAVVGLGISLRVRIMDYLKRAGRPCSEEEIEAAFDGQVLIVRRIERLVAGGHVRRENGRLVSGGTWLTRVARFNAQLKRFLTGQTSEFRQG